MIGRVNDAGLLLRDFVCRVTHLARGEKQCQGPVTNEQMFA